MLAGITPRTFLDGLHPPQLSMPASGYSTAVLSPFGITGYSVGCISIWGSAVGSGWYRQHDASLTFPASWRHRNSTLWCRRPLALRRQFSSQVTTRWRQLTSGRTKVPQLTSGLKRPSMQQATSSQMTSLGPLMSSTNQGCNRHRVLPHFVESSLLKRHAKVNELAVVLTEQ